MKQSICMIAALALFLLSAGYIEKLPAVSLVLLALMAIPMYIGRLDKKRVTAADIERRYGNAKNR